MKKVFLIVRNHLLEDFSWPYYLSAAAFLAFGILLNSHFRIESTIDGNPGNPMRIAYYILLYGAAYYTGVGLVVYFKKRKDILKNKSFWLLSGSGLLILCFDSGFPYLSPIMSWIKFDPPLFRWAYSVMTNAISVFLVGIPLLIVYWLSREARPNYFGLQLAGYDFRPYLFLLLCMAPLIFGASLFSDFNSYYPTYKPNPVAEILHWPKWVPLMIYEFFYAMDFFNLELLFRGFLIIGLSQVMGKDAVMPMVITYCFIHFGKPVGEQISSIFGGYILGVIALYTRGIWGGVIVHIGIAWMMEIAASLAR